MNPDQMIQQWYNTINQMAGNRLSPQFLMVFKQYVYNLLNTGMYQGNENNVMEIVAYGLLDKELQKNGFNNPQLANARVNFSNFENTHNMKMQAMQQQSIGMMGGQQPMGFNPGMGGMAMHQMPIGNVGGMPVGGTPPGAFLQSNQFNQPPPFQMNTGTPIAGNSSSFQPAGSAVHIQQPQQLHSGMFSDTSILDKRNHEQSPLITHVLNTAGVQQQSAPADIKPMPVIVNRTKVEVSKHSSVMEDVQVLYLIAFEELKNYKMFKLNVTDMCHVKNEISNTPDDIYDRYSNFIIDLNSILINPDFKYIREELKNLHDNVIYKGLFNHPNNWYSYVIRTAQECAETALMYRYGTVHTSAIPILDTNVASPLDTWLDGKNILHDIQRVVSNRIGSHRGIDIGLLQVTDPSEDVSRDPVIKIMLQFNSQIDVLYLNGYLASCLFTTYTKDGELTDSYIYDSANGESVDVNAVLDAAFDTQGPYALHIDILDCTGMWFRAYRHGSKLSSGNTYTIERINAYT